MRLRHRPTGSRSQARIREIQKLRLLAKRQSNHAWHDRWMLSQSPPRVFNLEYGRPTMPKPEGENWMDYGGRGITVCDSWLKFENFYADMGPRPSMGHSIERGDNDDGYHKDNCRWATRLEQGKNKRNNRIIEAFGKRQHLAEWVRQSGLHHTTILNRLARGWTNEKAVSTPAGRQGCRHS